MLRLKPEDSAPVRPLHARLDDLSLAVIDLLDLLRPLADEAYQLRDLFTAGRGDPLTVQRKAHPRAIELAEDAARALDAGEAVARAIRAAHAQAADLGVS